MPLKAAAQLRENIAELLRIRKEDQKTLAFHVGVHPTTINKFLKGTRELQLADLDHVADFFGVATYQLFQPGIAPLTERRRSTDRRSGRDRRIGHAHRQMLGLAAVVHPPKGGDHEATRPAAAINDDLKRDIARFLRQIEDRYLSQAEPRGQAAATGTDVSSPRPRRRSPRGSNAQKP